ncbi:hypothetical protein N7462_008228 [Penicillium macrosclerotiorum]|uniref:uncharacterized protein n=1 Tax=Penicillium macrosclerotiorum TaxID=303699 RepID=UPI00254853A2|nr:uncharacterized protein N7462_008228 [Penicillium macrosclerotiorum]KAJ5675331.1 hypothetical protein N7462_008228 [Penicillium macrosclerotiorum]
MDTLSPNLDDLSNRVSKAVQEIQKFLTQHGKSLSFDQQQPSPFSIETTEFRLSRMALFDAASTLMHLALSPAESILIQNSQACSLAQTVACIRYKFASFVPLDGSISYSDIAAHTGLNDNTVERVFGLLMIAHYFYSPRPDYVAHTNLSRLMAVDDRFEALIGLEFEDLHLWTSSIPDALARWGPSGEITETGLSIATTKGAATITPTTFWDHLEKNKASYDRFTDGSAYLYASDKFWTREIEEGFNWSAANNATVIDGYRNHQIGGSRGQASIALARKFPELQFIVQDYAHVCKEGETALPHELHDRIKFEAHDLFQPQLKVGNQKTIFLLRTILHDWSDKYACYILRAIIPAMKPEDRIVLVEMIMPEPGDGGEIPQRLVRMCDMEMWATFNSLERTSRQFKMLAENADSKLKIVNTYTPSWGGLSTIEIALED